MRSPRIPGLLECGRFAPDGVVNGQLESQAALLDGAGHFECVPGNGQLDRIAFG